MLMTHFYLNACCGNEAFILTIIVAGFFSSFFLPFMFRLVDKINVSIGQDPSSKCLIGVLDIYGFESFKTNR